MEWKSPSPDPGSTAGSVYTRIRGRPVIESAAQSPPRDSCLSPAATGSRPTEPGAAPLLALFGVTQPMMRGEMEDRPAPAALQWPKIVVDYFFLSTNCEHREIEVGSPRAG